MRLIWIFTNDNTPAVSTLNNVTTIEEITVDGEPAIRATVVGGTQYTTKRSAAQPVIQWD